MWTSLHLPFIISVTWACVAAAQSSSFPYKKCMTSSASSAYEVLPRVTNPLPNMYCFNLQARGCSTLSSCCESGDIADFVLHASAECDGAVITATLDNVPVPNVVISRPMTAPATRRVLTIPGLNLNSGTISPDGSRLCVTLPNTGRCNTFNRLAVGDSTWSAALVSSDGKCCPVSKGRPTPKPAKGTCETCVVWDVVGRDGTGASSTEFDYFSDKSCALPGIEGYSGMNCCQLAASYISGYFDWDRESGVVVGGFDHVVCDRTSIRMCGTLDINEVAAQSFNPGMIDSVYDITDSMCPVSLINTTIRLYTTKPGTNSLDTKCAPFSESIVDRCSEPTREEAMSGLSLNKPGSQFFPKESCDSTPGVTPFTVDPYEDLRFGNNTDLYCINIGTAAPAQPLSTCGQATAIDRVSFWMMDDDDRRANSLSVYLLTLKDGEYISTRLDATWGPALDNTLNVHGLDLDVASVNIARPKICIERGKGLGSNLGTDSVDDMNFLWTALYDNSGECCPAYYSNTY